MYAHLDSKDNQLVKQIVKLGHNRRYREECAQSVIYGVHLVEEALKAGVLEYLLIDANKISKYAALLTKLDSKSIYTASTSIINKLNLLDGDIDLVGVVSLENKALSDNVYHEDCLVLENIQDPLNLGSILRVAKASGVNNIVISANSVDLYNPKVLRSSQGAVFGLSVFTKVNLEEFVSNYTSLVIATLPLAKDSLYTTNLNVAVAWVFGNEGSGLSTNLLSKIIYQVAIPMQNDTESLNVAMAVTVCLFEQLRQRLK